MRTINLGKYILESADASNDYLELAEHKNIIARQGSDFFEIKDNLSVTFYDAVYYIHILEEYIEVVNIYKKGGVVQDIQIVHANDLINLNNMLFSVNFKCDEINLEKALSAFKNNNLVGPFSINKLLLNYAEKLKISDKQAVSMIITSIDIPEIDSI